MPIERAGQFDRPVCWVGERARRTDRRLFIADVANERVLSVKLGYHATERVALKNVPDAAGQ